MVFAFLIFSLKCSENNYSDKTTEDLKGNYSEISHKPTTSEIRTNQLKWVEKIIPLGYWNSVAYGNGNFVAVGNYGNVSTYSDDGFVWKLGHQVPKKEFLKSVIFVNEKNKFIAVGPNCVAISNEGKNWISTKLDGYWLSVAYGNDVFVAAGNDNKMAYSHDGWNWTIISINGDWQSVTFGQNKFVAVDSYYLISSEDGKNWTRYEIPSGNWNSITNNNDRFVALAYYGKTAYSTDGIDWQFGNHLPSGQWVSITYENGTFVAVGNNALAYSQDGKDWDIDNSVPTGHWQSLAYNGNDRYVVVGCYSKVAVCFLTST